MTFQLQIFFGKVGSERVFFEIINFMVKCDVQVMGERCKNEELGLTKYV